MNGITKAANAVMERIGHLVIWSFTPLKIGEIIPVIHEYGCEQDDAIEGPLIVVAETSFEEYSTQAEITENMPVEVLKLNLVGLRFWRIRAE